MVKPWWLRNLFNQIASFTVIEVAMYSNSIVDNATLIYFLLLHDTVALLSKNAYPDVDFLSSTSLPKSALCILLKEDPFLNNIEHN